MTTTIMTDTEAIVIAVVIFIITTVTVAIVPRSLPGLTTASTFMDMIIALRHLILLGVLGRPVLLAVRMQAAAWAVQTTLALIGAVMLALIRAGNPVNRLLILLYVMTLLGLCRHLHALLRLAWDDPHPLCLWNHQLRLPPPSVLVLRL